jgi:hypothetical protein
MDQKATGRSALIAAAVAALVGAALGFLASKLPFLQASTLLPWGAAALVVGYASPSGRASAVNGAAYGFALGFVFMIGGYAGSESLVSRIPFFAILGIVSALVAVAVSVAGYLLRTRLPARGSRA